MRDTADQLTGYMIEEGLLASETLVESGDAVRVTEEGYKVIAAVCIMRPDVALECRKILSELHFPTDEVYNAAWAKIMLITAVHHFTMIDDKVAVKLIKQIQKEARG